MDGPRMRVVSVNVARARAIPWRGGTVTTAIHKSPVEGRVRVGTLGLQGDEQADPEVHGGPHKAVYAYPREHYGFWQGELPGREWPWGTFGENLTTEGLVESEVRVGDRFRIGSALLEATRPRFPCYKLGIRFGRQDIIPRFLHSGRSGFYFAVVAEGDVGVGDAIVRVSDSPGGPTIADVVADRIRSEGGTE